MPHRRSGLVLPVFALYYGLIGCKGSADVIPIFDASDKGGGEMVPPEVETDTRFTLGIGETEECNPTLAMRAEGDLLTSPCKTTPGDTVAPRHHNNETVIEDIIEEEEHEEDDSSYDDSSDDEEENEYEMNGDYYVWRDEDEDYSVPPPPYVSQAAWALGCLGEEDSVDDGVNAEEDAGEEKPCAVTPSANLDFLHDGGKGVSIEDILEFERNGHIAVRGMFTPEELAAIRIPIVKAFMEEESTNGLRTLVNNYWGWPEDGEEEDYEMILRKYHRRPHGPFLQVFNLWRTLGKHSESVRRVVLSRRIGLTVKKLLGCPDGVVLYQDSSFLKSPVASQTGWHSDLNMCPLDTNRLVTIWIPLHNVASAEEGGSALQFMSGSHRDHALHHWYSRASVAEVKEGITYSGKRYPHVNHAPLEPGDVTFHDGWVAHSALGNKRRFAFTVSYTCEGVRTYNEKHMKTFHEEDKASWEDWLPSLPPGSKVKHSLLPVLPLDED